ncbi:MAG: CHASE domain-containing protein [Acidobacteria bacterium]|nr:CHASE domain-containing protein [Acidobacteriota bacterium]
MELTKSSTGLKTTMSSRMWAPYLVLVTGIALAIGFAWYTRENAEARTVTRFEIAAERVQNAIRSRLDAYIGMLLSGKALFAASDSVTREEFRRFVERLEVQQRYPGVQGIGYSVRLPAGRVESLTAQMHREGFPLFEIWPKDPPRPEYHAIIYLEPVDRRNRVALGYDMSTEPVRLDAMERARDSGRPAMSGKVTLVQEIDETKQAGFLIYVPYYSGSGVPGTVGQRRERLVGYVYSPFRADDLLQQVIGAEPNELQFQVYDGVERSSPNLLHTNGDSRDLMALDTNLKTSVAIQQAGRTWTIAVAARESLFPDAGRGGFIPLMGGLIIAFLLFGITRSQVQARTTAEQMAAEVRASEEALKQSVEREHAARTEAENANRLKDEFLATLSHELRTPLTPMLGWTHMLRTREFDKAGIQRGLQVIERNLRTQQKLIEDLLDVSRIISGKLHLKTRSMNLQGAIASVLEAIQPTARAKGIRIESRLDSTSRVFIGDPERLQQVISNVISNAVKFTPGGGSVRVNLSYSDNYAEIVVTDTGEGIAPEFLPYVFERFRQADSATTRLHGGLGLGLAIVHYLMELHGGTVEASSPGKGLGSTFTVRLPMKSDTTTEPARISHAR